MSSIIRTYDSLQPDDRKEWRDWLEINHGRSPGVWLIYYKRSSGKQTLSYEDAVQEALCFGWIDGRVKRLDEERYKQMFTPRKKGSTWARTNKQRVEKLIEEGRMTDAGLAKVKEAKEDGSWYRLESIDAEAVPDDLAKALRADPRAETNFWTMSASKRKQYLWWLAVAKRPETRSQRIEEIVLLAAKGKSKEGAVRRTERP